MTLSSFLTLTPVDLEQRPVALLDDLMDLVLLLDFDNFTSLIQNIINLGSFKGLPFLKTNAVF